MKPHGSQEKRSSGTRSGTVAILVIRQERPRTSTVEDQDAVSFLLTPSLLKPTNPGNRSLIEAIGISVLFPTLRRDAESSDSWEGAASIALTVKTLGVGASVSCLNLEEGDNTRVRFVRFDSSSSTTTSGMVPKGLNYVKKMFDRHEGPLGSWILLMLCLISISLDPLFFFIPVINGHKNCIALDKKLGVTACVLRSVIDFIYVIYISFQLQPDVSAPRYGVGNYTSVERARAVVWKLLRCHTVDLLAVLPLPQVVIIIIIATMRGSKFLNAMNSLKYFVFVQYVPRVIRIYPLFRKATRTLGIFAEATWSKAAFNFLIYLGAGHVYGALWYFLAVEREIKCWEKACRSHARCTGDSIDCYKSSENHVFFNDFCSTDTKIYDFGIFHDAVQSGILGRRNFVQKFTYCFRWGLQSLSCFGQNLITSTDLWENIFTISITVSSVLMFIFLIGNMQIYLQVKTIRSEEMKLKLREIEQWMPFKTLPVRLQDEVKRYQQHVWKKTKGVDVENLLNNLPKDLRRDIKRHLCLDILRRVPMFEKMDEQLLDIMCDRLKPVLYTEKSYIVREGDPVDEMLFIVQGNLLSITTNGGRPGYFSSARLTAGDFCGEELLTWVLSPMSSSDTPLSTRTVRAHSEVEAYAIIANDLKLVASQFRRFYSGQVKHTFRFYSQHWRTWAACFIQAAWRRYCKRKLNESFHAEEDSLQHALANACASPPSLGATIYATRFNASALQSRRHSRSRKARIPESVPPMLLQKPPEPDFTAEDQ